MFFFDNAWIEKYNRHRYAQRAVEVNKEKQTRKIRYPVFVSYAPEFPFCKMQLHIYEPKYSVFHVFFCVCLDLLCFYKEKQIKS